MFANRRNKDLQPVECPVVDIEKQDISFLEEQLSQMNVPEPPQSVRTAWTSVPHDFAAQRSSVGRMVRRFVLVPAAAALILAAVALMQRPSLPPALADVIEAARNVKSVHFVSRMMDDKTQEEFEFWASGNKWRKVHNGNLEEISDGKTVYHFQPSRSSVLTSKAGGGPEMVYEIATGLDVEQIVRALEDKNLVITRQEVTYKGRRCLLLDISRTDGSTRFRIYHDPQTKLAEHAVVDIRMDDGSFKPVWTIDAVDYNVNVDESLFTPDIPKGWQVREWNPPQNQYERTTSLPSERSGFGVDYRKGQVMNGPGNIISNLSVKLLDVCAGTDDNIVVKFQTRGLNQWAHKDLFMRGVAAVDSDTKGQGEAFLAGGGPDDPADRDLSIRDGIHVLTLKHIRGHDGDIPAVADIYFFVKMKKGNTASPVIETGGSLPEPWVNAARIGFENVPVRW